MRRAMVFLALAASLISVAGAASENLAGGVMITHYVPELVYSLDPPAEGWCNAYTPYALTDSEDQNARFDGTGVGFIWFVLAAWTEEKVWCGAEFGLGAYSTAVVAINSGEPCFPGEGLEIPDGTWPAPNTGTAMVVTTTQWTGNYVPVYYFDCYAYGGAGQIPLAKHLLGEDLFAGFASCEQPPALEQATLGALGVNTPGVEVHPVFEEVFACCIGTTCQLLTELGCSDQGGEWLTGEELCTPNPCDPEAACCWGSTPVTCTVMTESNCLARPGGGTWHESIPTCAPNPCQVAACCAGETCTLLTELDCLSVGGRVWKQSEDTCDPNPCLLGACCIDPPNPQPYCWMLTYDDCVALNGGTPLEPGDHWHPTLDCNTSDPCYPNPVEESSWGRIKKLYQ